MQGLLFAALHAVLTAQPHKPPVQRSAYILQRNWQSLMQPARADNSRNAYFKEFRKVVELADVVIQVTHEPGRPFLVLAVPDFCQGVSGQFPKNIIAQA